MYESWRPLLLAVLVPLVVALVTATGTSILRGQALHVAQTELGRRMDEHDRRYDRILSLLTSIDQRLSRMEGRQETAGARPVYP